jgi:hypothetical protein
MADNSLAVAQEATKFVQSEWGKHYITRLERIRDEYRKKAGLMNISEAESRALSVKATAYDDELSYFQTAQTIVSSPSLVKMLKEKLKSKGDSTV